MSWKAMREFLEKLPDGLSAPECSVLTVLRIRTGDNPTCFPSQRRIARETGLEERTVRRVIARLELRRLLCVTRRGEDQRSHEYALQIPDTASAIQPSKNRTQRPPLRRGNSGHSRQNTGHSVPKIPDTESTEGINLKDKEDAGRAGHLDGPRPRSTEDPLIEGGQIGELIDQIFPQAKATR